jgi:hypothetical protein
LKARNGADLDIHVGRFKQRTIGRCKVCRQDYLCACPTTYVTYEEKETDVALGVAMVEDAARRIGEVSVLVSADSDLIPAIESTKRLDATRPIYLAMPPSRARGASRFQGVGIFGVSKPGAPGGAVAGCRYGSGVRAVLRPSGEVGLTRRLRAGPQHLRKHRGAGEGDTPSRSSVMSLGRWGRRRRLLGGDGGWRRGGA